MANLLPFRAMPDQTRDMPQDNPWRSGKDPFDHQPAHHPDNSPPSEEHDQIGSTARVYACPYCENEVAVNPDQTGAFITCPHCGEHFSMPEDAPAPEDASDAEESARRRDAELDGMRIRQVSLARRAAIRARTYLLIGTIACLSGAEELIRKIVIAARHGHGRDSRTFAFGAFAVVGLLGAGYFWTQFVAIGRELKKPLLDEPTKPPDFSSLSDGSQQWKDLDDVQ